MRFIAVFVLAWTTLLFSAVKTWGDEIVLANGGKSPYQIVMADNASPSTKHGAQELQKFLEEMTGAKLPIVSDAQPASSAEIILGDNAHFKALKTDIDVASLGKEGYVIRTVGNHLVIVGGALRGNMYGVYGLLEDHLGCRWFTPDCSRIPKSDQLKIGKIDDRQVPALEYREPFTTECFDGDWCARNRMNSSRGRLDADRGGNVAFAGGFFCHTFGNLVPPAKYYAEHPEYFALVKGKREKEQRELPAQLCCTNPEVIRICIEGIQNAMRAQPAATVFSVSQNDAYEDNYCECENCQALAKAEESQMAPVLQLVNKVAEAVEKEFPDKIVETLAYQWGTKPPKTIRPRSNVVIRLCSGACCFSHPLANCDYKASQEFCNNLNEWSKAAPRLWVWDYASSFGHYLMPFPNQRTRASNVAYYIAHGVKGIFEQDAYDSVLSELSCLGGYITAKCLWNPNYKCDTAMNEFLNAYYGKADGPIRQYIDLLHNFAEQEHIHINLSVQCNSPHLNDDLLAKGNALWQQAETLVADDPALLQRVQFSRMSVDYAILERARLRENKQLPENNAAAMLAKNRFQPFSETLLKSPLTRFHEGADVDKKAYLDNLAKDLQIPR